MQPLYQQVHTHFKVEESGRIEALLFTTFGLDVRYFERAILPSFFPELGEGPAAEPHRPLFEYLEETPVPISVIFDHDNFVGADKAGQQTGLLTKELRWQAHAVLGRNNCFHPKLVLALVHHDDGTRGIVIGCGSANLTKPGWGHNLEACVFQTIWLYENVQDGVLVDLQALLADFRRLTPDSISLQLIENAINDANPRGFQRRKEQQHYRVRLWHPALGKSLTNFLKSDVLHGDLASDDWQLEVVSPYYTETPAELFEWALGQLPDGTDEGGAPRILCCCPQEDGKFTITAEAADNHVSLGNLGWASLAAEYTRSRLRDADGNARTRRLHAKIFRFWCPTAEVFIVGSANATRQGCGDDNGGNDEACLIFSRPAPPRKPLSPWLTYLVHQPDEGSCVSDSKPPEDKKVGERLPHVKATFDWATNQLALRNHSRKTVGFYLSGRQEPLAVVGPKKKQICDESAIRVAMYQSPAIRIASEDDSEKRFLFLVEETNLQLKPPAPTMERSADELIQDWQKGFDERLSEHVARSDETAYLSTDKSYANDLDETESDRLNDVLLALWRFRQDMRGLLTPDNAKPDEFSLSRVHSRVFGAGAMSVRNLVKKLFEAADEDDQHRVAFDAVELYISMLGVNDAVESIAKDLRAAGFGAELRKLKKDLSTHTRQARMRIRKDLDREDSPYPAADLLDWVDSNFRYRATSTPQ